MPRLSVPVIGQETEMWCWAASAEMIMAFHGLPVAQCEQANHWLRRADVCQSPTPADAVQGGWPDFLHWGFTYVVGDDGAPLSYADIQAQIDEGLPFAFSWKWSGTATGHMMIGYGYGEAAGDSYVHVIDPWPVATGDTASYTYDNFVAGDVWQGGRAPHTHWRDYWDIAPTRGRQAIGPGGRQETDPLPVVRSTSAGLDAAVARGRDAISELDYPAATRGHALEISGPGGAPQFGWEEPDLRVMYIFEDRLLEFGGGDVGGLLEDGRERIVPLSTDGQVTSSVVVVEREDRYRIEVVGRPNLTSAIAAARRQHAIETDRSPSDYFVVHVPHMYRVYLGVEGGSGIELVPVIMSGEPTRDRRLALADMPRTAFDTSAAVAELMKSARTYPAALPTEPRK